jgi:hypothetical protein
MSHTRLREIVCSTACRIVAAYCAHTELAEAGAEDRQRLFGIIGLRGDLAGTFVVAASEAALTATIPIEGGDLQSWIAELTNQLAGGVATELGWHGIDVSISLPFVLTSTRVAPTSSIDPIHVWVGNGVVSVWLDVVEGVTIIPAAMTASESMGDVMFL